MVNVQFKRCKPLCKPYHKPFLGLQTSFLLLLMSSWKCIPLIVKVVEQNKYLFHNFCYYNTNFLKKFSTEFQKRLQELSRSSPLNPLQYWYPKCAESPAHLQLVCNICRWQSHRKSANIDQGQGECIYILAILWNCKMVFRFWTSQRVLKSLCVDII